MCLHWSIATSFVDKQSDETVKQKSAFGVAGWAKDDSAVWLYDKLDIWSVSPDGTKSKRLTDGASVEIVRHDYRADGLPSKTTHGNGTWTDYVYDRRFICADCVSGVLKPLQRDEA